MLRVQRYRNLLGKHLNKKNHTLIILRIIYNFYVMNLKKNKKNKYIYIYIKISLKLNNIKKY